MECDDLCKEKKEQLDRIREIEVEKKRKEDKLKNQKEIEMFEKKFKRKQRGRNRHHLKEELKNKSGCYSSIWMFAGLAVGISIVILLTF